MNVGINKIAERLSNFFADKGYSLRKRNSLITPIFKDTFNPSAAHLQIRNIITGKENFSHSPKFFLIDPCFRHVDIGKVGYSYYHLSLFEMAASVYVVEKKEALDAKEETIRDAFYFLTKEVGISPNKLLVTVFGGGWIGSSYFESDHESLRVWKALGVPEERVISIQGEKNFTYLKGENEPAGPRCEIYFDRGSRYGNIYRYIELGTTIFESYRFDKDAQKLISLENSIYGNAWGVERLSLIVEEKDSIYQISAVSPLISIIENWIRDRKQANLYRSEINLIADHIRSIAFIICDGQLPDNSRRGQRLRRLTRSLVSTSKTLCNCTIDLYDALITTLMNIYKIRYPELYLAKDKILSVIKEYTKR